jgi:hypothetical protein
MPSVRGQSVAQILDDPVDALEPDVRAQPSPRLTEVNADECHSPLGLARGPVVEGQFRRLRFGVRSSRPETRSYSPPRRPHRWRDHNGTHVPARPCHATPQAATALPRATSARFPAPRVWLQSHSTRGRPLFAESQRPVHRRTSLAVPHAAVWTRAAHHHATCGYIQACRWIVAEARRQFRVVSGLPPGRGDEVRRRLPDRRQQPDSHQFR